VSLGPGETAGTVGTGCSTSAKEGSTGPGVTSAPSSKGVSAGINKGEEAEIAAPNGLWSKSGLSEKWPVGAITRELVAPMLRRCEGFILYGR
jgi:hypothetical protein